MVFSSLVFVCCFLPLVTAAYFLSRSSWRNPVLVAASLLFYAWAGIYATVLVVGLIVANLLFGRMIDSREGRARRTVLVAALSFNLLIFVVFKYSGFLLENVNGGLALVSSARVPVWPIVLPLGISFFTFHIISYLVDVYRRARSGAAIAGAFALYIVNLPAADRRPDHPLSRDRRSARRAARSRLADVDAGVRRFTVGLVEEAADRRSDRRRWSTGSSRCRADRAHQRHGLARHRLLRAADLLRLLRLFRHGDRARAACSASASRRTSTTPMPRRSMREFWRRWHMTLSAWFRDYVYVPLGGNRARRLDHRAQSVDRVLARGRLARRQLEFCRLGPVAGPVPLARTAASGRGGVRASVATRPASRM